MKTLITACLSLLLITARAQSPVLGAWSAVKGADTSILLITPAYFSITSYNASGFKSTLGGSWEGGDDGAVVTVEFNTADSTLVGKNVKATADFNGQQLTTSLGSETTTWTRVDDGVSPMAGVWRITARENNGQMSPIDAGPRKTIKILTGKKFQWVAINTATGQFFGTGGGSYTFDNGVYTEHIEYFSRDNSRVGASLQFKGLVNGNKWEHSGKSSQGQPLKEEWTRE
jgi:hypothetical protein